LLSIIEFDPMFKFLQKTFLILELMSKH